jgi:menaquinone-dependent protoporphyrinogen oxidase
MTMQRILIPVGAWLNWRRPLIYSYNGDIMETACYPILPEERTMKVLLGYASAHGSTAEVAQFIGKTLQEKGLTVTVASVESVVSVEGYQAFILGTAIHSGTWLPAMTAFIGQFQAQLIGKPIYMWVSCIRVLEQFGEEHVMEYYMAHDLLHPLMMNDVAVFAGKLDLNATDWNERWTLAARYDGSTWPSSFDGDFRDWDKIRAWAEKTAAGLLAIQASGQA